MGTTTLPFARSMPAASAAVCPKLRRNFTSTTVWSAFAMPSSTPYVLSVEPSSTKIISYARPNVSSTPLSSV